MTTVTFVQRSDDTFVAHAPGYVHTHVELLNPKFVLCCSRPGVDLGYLRERFGRWLVKIDQPRRLAQEISDYLGTLPYRFAGGIEGCPVHYNKGGKVRPGLTTNASTRLSYAQKPVAFIQDREFRFVAIVTGTPGSRFDGDYLSIDLGHALNYVSVIL